jgi:two-component system, LytTR family, sensor kinase
MFEKLIHLWKADVSEFAPKDKWVRIIGIPTISLMITFLVPKTNPYSESDLLLAVAMCIFFTYIHWEGSRFIIIRLRYLYQSYSETVKRIVVMFIASSVFSAFVSFFVCYTVTTIFLGIQFRWEYSWVNFKIGLAATIFIATIYECFYFSERWEKTVIEAEKLKRENLISQFETLKNQVNPHFLFNSFNTLMTIIPENTEIAVEFVQKLSNVYRYVLNNKDKELVELSTEIAFLKDYIFLHKIRFGENLKVNFNLPESILGTQIPPLTLQMLMENAVKHNIISSEKPLIIDIYLETNNNIVMENNLQKRSIPAESTQVGLQNIINRYKYLSQKVVEIISTTTIFKVSLPIISIEKNEGSNY